MSDKPPSTSSEAKGADVGNSEQLAKIDSLIENRQKSAGFSWDNFISYGLGAGVTGYMAVGPAVGHAKGMMFRKQLENPEFRKAYDSAATIAEKDGVIAKNLTEILEHLPGTQGKFVRSLFNNQKTWELGVTAVSVGAVLGWELWQQNVRATLAKTEVKDLTDLKKSWVERMAESGKDSPSATPQK